MRLSVATNWDPDLLGQLQDYPVYDLFGALAMNVVGGGRPSLLLCHVSSPRC